MELTERQRHILVKLLRNRLAVMRDKKAFKKLRKKAVMRYKRVEEMVNTETGYLASLDAIRNGIRNPLLEKSLITPKDADAIFSNI